MAMDFFKRIAKGSLFGETPAVPQWRAPVILDRGTLGEARLALNGEGYGLALWGNGGGLWTMPIGPASTPGLMRLPMGTGIDPRIVISPDGRGIALWVAEELGEREVLGKILGCGETTAQTIFRSTGQISHLQAAVDRRGNALVVWLHEKEGAFEVMAQTFDTRGKAWEQTPTSLGIPSREAVKPHIAVNDREHAMVLWEVQEGGFEGLVASHYWPSERIWSDRPVSVVDHATHHHQVVMDELGNALALWVHAPYGQRSSIEASYYDVHKSEWEAPRVLASAHHFTPPRLVMTANGEALAAWCQGEGHTAPRLFARGFKKGSWESETECLDPGHGSVRDYSIALGRHGQAGLITVQRGPDGDWVAARLKQGTWSVPMQLGPATQTPRSAPRLCLCPQGASVLWIQGEGAEKALVLAEWG